MSYSNRTALVGATVVLPDAALENQAVVVNGGVIEAIQPLGALPSDIARLDLGGGYLAPGLIDIHGHGADRCGFNEGTTAAFLTAGRKLLAEGVTTCLPTLASAPLEDMLRALAVLREVRGEPGLPAMPGAHLEGPYFSLEQRGAQSIPALRHPDDGSVDRFLEVADIIRMISYAPELPGAVELTRRLVAAGIVAAAGHSNGTDEDLARCQAAGLSHVIHIYSGQSTTIRRGPWRVPGMLEATLASSGLTVEMIADGRHLPDTLMRVAYRCLKGNLCLVSDATAGAGLEEGTVYQIGEERFQVENGVGVTMDRTAFAGSTTLLPRMLPIAYRSLGVTVPEVVAMVTDIPARAVRLAGVGRLAPGYRADFVHLDEGLNVVGVAQAGVWLDR